MTTDNQDKTLQPDDELTVEEQQLLRMALERDEQVAPDVEAAWADVSRRTGLRRPARRLALWAVGAAACLVGAVLVLRHPSTPTEPIAQRESAPVRHAVSTPRSTVEKTMATVEEPKEQTVEIEAASLRATTGRREIRQITLPDGTKVWLNANSTLAYSGSADARHVDLEGEAYFEVTHNAQRPFTVTTPYMQTTDLGTAFNVVAYSPREASVTLVSGLVAVQTSEHGTTLKPGQQATVNGTTMRVTAIDTYPTTQWRDGWFYHKSSSLQAIMQELARWYEVNVVFEDQSLPQRKLHFVASRNESLDEVAERLSEFDGISVEVKGKQVVVASQEEAPLDIQ